MHEHPRANVVIRSPFDSFETSHNHGCSRTQGFTSSIRSPQFLSSKKNLAKSLWGCQGILYYKTARNSTKCLIHTFWITQYGTWSDTDLKMLLLYKITRLQKSSSSKINDWNEIDQNQTTTIIFQMLLTSIWNEYGRWDVSNSNPYEVYGSHSSRVLGPLLQSHKPLPTSLHLFTKWLDQKRVASVSGLIVIFAWLFFVQWKDPLWRAWR